MFLDRFASSSGIIATEDRAVVFGKHLDRVPASGGEARRTPGCFVAGASHIIAGRDDGDDARRNALRSEGPFNQPFEVAAALRAAPVVPGLIEETRGGLSHTLKEVDQPWR